MLMIWLKNQLLKNAINLQKLLNMILDRFRIDGKLYCKEVSNVDAKKEINKLSTQQTISVFVLLFSSSFYFYLYVFTMKRFIQY